MKFLYYAQPCHSYAPSTFLQSAEGQPRFYFESARSPLAFAAAGIAAQIQSAGETRFDDLSRGAKDLFAQIENGSPDDNVPPPFLTGGSAFFPHLPAGQWSGFPAAALILPRRAVLRWKEQTFAAVFLPIHAKGSPSSALAQAKAEAEEILRQLDGAARPTGAALEFQIREGGQSEWEDSVRRAIQLIEKKAIQKVVLARALDVESNGEFDLPALLRAMGTACPDCFRFLFEPQTGMAFAGGTPERLISVEGGRFTSAAVAGSAPRGFDEAEDAALGEELLHSQKNLSEHAIVRERIEQCLAPLAQTLHVAAAPRLMRLPNIQHLHTPMYGQVKDSHNALDLAAALHPTPAVGGAPGVAALRWIEALETLERGWYAAPIGWLNAKGDGDFAVAIRSGLFYGRRARLFGGAGIVANSEPAKEWEETRLKIRFLLNALQFEEKERVV
ncbi:MAG: isochorismate synthase [Anaerolineales bacterium]